MSRSRRRALPAASDEGTDSFLDILANLVGILVILVVVVAIRVRTTVAPSAVPVAVERLRPARPQPPVDPFRTQPLVVDFATPAAVREETPPVSDELLRQLARARQEADRLAAQIAELSAAPEPMKQGKDLSKQIASLSAQKVSLTRELERVTALAAARASDAGRLQREVGRLVRELEQVEDPPPVVESLTHEVRSLARAARGPQYRLELRGGLLTVLPDKELIPKVQRHLRDSLRRPRFDGVYLGKVGPVGGVTLSYAAKKAATSAMDSVTDSTMMSVAAVAEFWFTVDETAERVAVREAVSPGSRLRRVLATAPKDATFACIVSPDSYPEARVLQDFMKSRPQRLAFLPVAADTPAVFGTHGADVMTQ